MKYYNFSLIKDRQKFYQSKEWSQLRSYILSQNPLCVKCKEENIIMPATEIDHIIPLKIAPQLRLDVNNLSSLCKPHHSQKTYLETLDKTRNLKLTNKLWNT